MHGKNIRMCVMMEKPTDNVRCKIEGKPFFSVCTTYVYNMYLQYLYSGFFSVCIMYSILVSSALGTYVRTCILFLANTTSEYVYFVVTIIFYKQSDFIFNTAYTCTCM